MITDETSLVSIFLTQIPCRASSVSILNSVQWFYSKEKCVLCHKYFRYLHETYTFMLTILSATRQAKSNLYSTCTIEIGLSDCIIYSSAYSMSQLKNR